MTNLALIAPVQIIVDVLKPILIFIHDTFGVGWGVSIVLLTVVVRAALAPLTVKQFKSMRAIATVAPQMKELKAKYPDDRQRQQQELMKLYAKHKINPFASCLPIAAQFPFFIGLYYLLQTDLRHEICGDAAGVVADATGKLPPCGEIAGSTGAEKFLFIPDLTAGATGWVLAALLILYISSQLVSTLLTPTTPDRNQQIIMYGLPLMFALFILFYEFPAGLLVYWITTNLWTVGQGYVIRRKLGPIPSMKDVAAGDDEDDTRGGGNFFSRLASGVAAQTSEPVPATPAKSTPSGPPPRPPRKKKKRSGRRR
jgi:YidC/Oxa1 family membrane protein insertase